MRSRGSQPMVIHGDLSHLTDGVPETVFIRHVNRRLEQVGQVLPVAMPFNVNDLGGVPEEQVDQIESEPGHHNAGPSDQEDAYAAKRVGSP